MTRPSSLNNFANPDYQDSFTLTAGSPFESLDEFVERFSRNQPQWLLRLSTGLKNKAQTEAAIRSLKTDNCPTLGNWHRIESMNRTISFGEDIRVLRYRLTFTRVSPTDVIAGTDVVYQTRLLGALYWTLAAPVHRTLFQRMLNNAGGDSSSVAEISATLA